jgi:predicted Rossmann fold flavoprotein
MTHDSKIFDVIVLGAGAAGLMCARTAAQRGRSVMVLEHTNKVGAKILISGGGRCNFTNLNIEPKKFISNNPHFCTSALSRYTQHDFIALVQRHGIAYHEKTLGQLFCDGSARAIVAMLMAECAHGNVDVRTDHSVTQVTRTDHFSVETNAASFQSKNIVLATGGLSIPKMGATGLSYDIARHFGLRITPTRPGLVPMTLDPDQPDLATELSGVACEAIASLNKTRFRENILFTHRGLSGPAILQISSYWHQGQSIVLDLAPDIDIADKFLKRKKSNPKLLPHTVLSEILPARLAQALTTAHLTATELANIPDRTLVEFSNKMKSWPLIPSGTEGYAKAEVTVGGIDTNDLSSKTMQARHVPGLYAIGEAVDVTGWLGGYNFQWAWSSGWAAGQAV